MLKIEDYYVAEIQFNKAEISNNEEKKYPWYKHDFDSFNVPFESFDRFIKAYDYSEKIFQIVEFFDESDLDRNQVFGTLIVLEKDFDINKWEHESKLDYDNKIVHINGKNSRVTRYYKMTKRDGFLSEEYLCIQVILRKGERLKYYTNLEHIDYFGLAKDVRLLYEHIAFIKWYKKADKQKHQNKFSEMNGRNKEELRLAIIDNFIPGQCYFHFLELWNLSDFQSNRWVQDFLNEGV